MPTYEFKCGACGEHTEVFQSMSAPDPEACEHCGAVGQLQKVLFPVAVHYKGSGFYSTDYVGKKSGGSAGDSGSGSEGGSSSSEGGSSPASGSDSTGTGSPSSKDSGSSTGSSGSSSGSGSSSSSDS
ncbi:MAG: hypothetical protein JWM98_893 [Thermoleophilia bacterium]|nr:hypothetical protein [Thermoleophilia bacterium]